MRRLILTALLLAAAAAAHAQAWPERGPVTVICSNSAGSTPDVIARMVAEALTQSLKQRFIVENRPGANGFLATMAAVRAKPDGYTLYLSGNSALAANPHTLKSMPYDAEKDLTPITIVINSAPLMIVAHPSLPVNTLAELIKYAKEHPGQIAYGANGSLAPFLGPMLAKEANVNMRMVRYKNSAESVQDTVAGRTMVNFIGKTQALPLIEDKKLKVLAIAGRERYPLMPEVRAMEEDYPGIAVEGWFILLGPAGFPEEISERIRKALDPWLKSAPTQKVFHDLGVTTIGTTSTQRARDFIRGESERWARIVKETGYKPQ
jgi:tripartite-type tricarboxylate transporter receptor subunit TctC